MKHLQKLFESNSQDYSGVDFNYNENSGYDQFEVDIRRKVDTNTTKEVEIDSETKKYDLYLFGSGDLKIRILDPYNFKENVNVFVDKTFTGSVSFDLVRDMPEYYEYLQKIISKNPVLNNEKNTISVIGCMWMNEEEKLFLNKRNFKVKTVFENSTIDFYGKTNQPVVLKSGEYTFNEASLIDNNFTIEGTEEVLLSFTLQSITKQEYRNLLKKINIKNTETSNVRVNISFDDNDDIENPDTDPGQFYDIYFKPALDIGIKRLDLGIEELTDIYDRIIKENLSKLKAERILEDYFESLE